jgi:hypothetical protein
MKNQLAKIFICLFLSIQTVSAANWVLCSIWKYEGCEGYEAPRSGSALSLGRSGNAQVGRTERVERRTIIKIPDWKIRRFWRSLGLGGNRINISYTEGDTHNCPQQNETTPDIENPLLKGGSFSDCMSALQYDLLSAPQGIRLNVVQCQDYFCNEPFIEQFNEFLEKTNNTQIRNVEQFLACPNASIDV